MTLLIVRANFYQDLADELTAGATQALESAGNKWDIIDIPGALEAPAAIAMAIDSGRYDGYIALGCVIRGETTHYDYVCNESARGLNELAIKHRAAIANGILTVENYEQAWARAKRNEKNKGAFVANAALRMIAIRKQFTTP